MKSVNEHKEIIKNKKETSFFDELEEMHSMLENEKEGEESEEEESEEEEELEDEYEDLDEYLNFVVDIDLEYENELDESGKFIRTKRIKDSAKVVKQTTDELFGKNGSSKKLVAKIFKVFKKALKKKAKEMNVPLGNIKSHEIKLRDYSSDDVGKTLSGKKIGG